MNKIRQIIREELNSVFNEVIMNQDPVKISQDMVASNEAQLKVIQDELKFRENDARVSGLPPEEKKARIERVKMKKKELELAKQELELAKQSQLSAVQMQQQNADSAEQSQVQSQVNPQT